MNWTNSRLSGLHNIPDIPAICSAHQKRPYVQLNPFSFFSFFLLTKKGHNLSVNRTTILENRETALISRLHPFVRTNISIQPKR